VLAEAQLHAVGLERLGERLAERGRLAGQQMPRPLDQRHLPAEAGHRLGHLHADGAAAQDQEAAGDLGHRRDLAVGPQAGQLAQPGNRRDDRRRARGQDDALGLVNGSADLHPAGARDPPRAADQVDPMLREPSHLARVVPAGGDPVAKRERLPDIERPGDRLPRAWHAECGGQRVARPQQRLGGHAGPVGALARHELALHDRDPHPLVGQRACADLAAGTRSDHDRLVSLAHAPPLPESPTRTTPSAAGPHVTAAVQDLLTEGRP